MMIASVATVRAARVALLVGLVPCSMVACGGSATPGPAGDTTSGAQGSSTAAESSSDSGSTGASTTSGSTGAPGTSDTTTTAPGTSESGDGSSSGGLEPTDACAHDVTLSLVGDRTAVLETTCKEGPCGPMHLALHRVVGGDDGQRLPTDEGPGLTPSIAVRLLERDREVALTQRETLQDAVRILEVDEDGPAIVVDTVELLGSESLTINDVDGDGLEEIVSGEGYLSIVHYDPFDDAWVVEEVGGPYGAESDDPSDGGRHAEGVAVGDIDGDEEPEIVLVLEQYVADPEDPPVPGLILAYDFFDDAWHESAVDVIPHPRLQDVAIADFDGDGHNDVVVGGTTSSLCTRRRGTHGRRGCHPPPWIPNGWSPEISTSTDEARS